MTEHGMIGVIAVLGSLVLVGTAFASYRAGAKETVRLALIWGGIFVAVTIVFTMISE